VASLPKGSCPSRKRIVNDQTTHWTQEEDAENPSSPAKDAAYLAKATALTVAFAAISNDPAITGDREEELDQINVAHGSPMFFSDTALLLTENVLERVIHKLSVGYCPGPDGIPAGLPSFMWNAPAGRVAIHQLVFASMSLVSVPMLWEKAIIIHPILKAGSKDFRPHDQRPQVCRYLSRYHQGERQSSYGRIDLQD
jgi:hypothetical protein